MENKKFIENIKNRDIETINMLISDNLPIIKNVIKKTGITDTKDIEDIFNETIYVFIDKCKNNLVLTCKPSSYMSSIAINLSKKYYNKYMSRTIRYDHSIHNMSYYEISNDFIDKDNTILNRCIKKLPDSQQKFIRLFLKGYNHKEIAEKMGYSNTNVSKTKKSKIIKSIKNMVS